MYINDIPASQNDPRHIRLLRAPRSLYRAAKRLLAVQVVAAVALPLGGAIAMAIWPSIKGFVALAALTIAILDVTILDRAQRAILRTAAKVQEQFDCEVLGLSWNRFSMGSMVEPERIHRASKLHNDGAEDPKLCDWYPVVVGEVSLHLARIICQRCNLWYDANLRRHYGNWIKIGTIATCVAIVVAGLVGSMSVESLVLSILAPAAPVIIWGVREHLRQHDTADALDRLRTNAEELWEDAVTGKCNEIECTSRSRLFQNAIYDRRSSSPPIFEWIYDRLKNPLEDQMNIGAGELVAQARDRSCEWGQ